MGKTCVCGAEELDVDTKRRRFTAPDGTSVHEGDVISIDGTTGEVYLGEVPVVAVRRWCEYFEGSLDPSAPRRTTWCAAVAPADGARRRGAPAAACAPTPTPPRTPRGPAGSAPRASACAAPSTCSSASGASCVERLILAEDDDGAATQALDALLPLQRGDFIEIFEAMDGLPVTVRLLDPPLHEFLPDLTELSVRVAVAEARGEANENDLRLLQAVHRLHEQNPMLGLRGVRLGLVVPGLFDDAGPGDRRGRRAAVEAGRRPAGRRSWSRWSAAVQELEIIRERRRAVARRGRRADRRAARVR